MLRLNDKRKLPMFCVSRLPFNTFKSISIDDLGRREDLEPHVELSDLLCPPVAFAQDQGVPPGGI